MKLHLRNLRSSARTCGFTMVEVAISIAIVAFALVAIIGVMPTGLNVQKENREDTLVNADASFLLEAIRGGANSANLNVLAGNLVSLTANPAPPVTNAMWIISCLSMPQSAGSCQAVFRSFSGNLRDQDPNGQLGAFSYQVASEINPVQLDPTTAANYPTYAAKLASNLFDVKLTFRWPIYGTNFGNGRLVVRTRINGQLSADTNSVWAFRTNYFGP